MATLSGVVSQLLLEAADAGVLGPPTNPFDLAERMGIVLRPQFDVRDARLVRGGDDTQPTSAPLGHFVASNTPLIIEYNPTRPRGRLRYSVAHELAHALFADAGDAVRHRTATGAVAEVTEDDSWQLELLCNVAAAELLMPTTAVEGLLNSDTDIDFLMAERARFNVSTEAMLRRLVHATDRPMAVAAFSRIHESPGSDIRCEYVLGSRTWTGNVHRGMTFTADTILASPAAVGQTARGTVPVERDEVASIQAVGVPPYPGSAFPRVLALFEPEHAARTAPDSLRFVTADVATASAEGPVVIAHVVSDSARAWSNRGVAGALRGRFPEAAAAFRSWSVASPDNLELGRVHVVDAPREPGKAPLLIASMVVQRGYGPSPTTRLSYVALAEALGTVGREAAGRGAEVHIPRIGAGQAGGRWDLIETTIERVLLADGVKTVIYTKPSGQTAGKTPGRR
jgi:hypothetical protein